MRVSDVERLARRRRFSDYLPWIAWDPKRRMYLNQDNTFGWLWECQPLAFAGEETARLIEGLFRLALPRGSQFQFMLAADPRIDPLLDAYRRRKVRPSPLAEKATASFLSFLSDASGLAAVSGVPPRRFRAFVALKSSSEVSPDDLAVAGEILAGAGLAPQPVDPAELLDWLRRIFHPDAPPAADYDPHRPIARQLIPADWPVHRCRRRGKGREEPGLLRAGGQSLRCLSPKVLPKTADAGKTNRLAGGPMGLSDDADQIPTPFLWTTTVVLDDEVKNAIHLKGSLTMSQQAVGTAAAELSRRIEEFRWAVMELDEGRFVRALTCLWVIGRTSEEARRASSRARRMWESQGYVMQEETMLLLPLLIASLPFGLYAAGRNLDLLDRDFPVPAQSLARVLPIQADFAGSGRPMLLLCGRKGQVAGVDLFDSRLANQNFLVTAATGNGKSFFLNNLVFNHWSENGLTRIVDLGGSYRRLAGMLGGRVLDVGDRRRPPVLNPWAHLEDPEMELGAVASIVAQMATSNTNAPLDELDWTLLKDAVRFAWERDRGEAGLDHVREFLHAFPQHASEHADRFPQGAREKARTLGYVLCDWCSEGRYGRFFTGRGTLSMAEDELVVLELESLRRDAALFKVLTLQVLNAVTQDLYLSDRSRRRMIVFDEAWQFMDNAGPGSQFGPVLEEGYRRARKYGGAFGSVFQSPLDLQRHGRVGDVMWGNSATRLLLHSPDYARAQELGMLDKDPSLGALLRTLRTVPGRYSEVYVDSGHLVRGVARMMVDPYSYLIYTTTPGEVARIEELAGAAGDYAGAIERLLGEGAPAPVPPAGAGT